MAVDADHLHRTVKLEIDEGRAGSLEEALALARSYALNVKVGAGINERPAQEAILLTVLNCAHRAFLGGVCVQIEDDPILKCRWAQGRTLSEAILAFGGTLATELADDRPCVVIGRPSSASRSKITVFPTCEGWSGGVVDRDQARLAEEHPFVLTGVLAGALSVSECFQSHRGNLEAGRRDIGLSLWRPDVDWLNAEASGPPCRFLPNKLWLLGLGHLGQAYCWALGFLPYNPSEEALLYLQDYDLVVRANESTGLLVEHENVGQTKARMVAAKMEAIGFDTRVVERAFNSHTKRTADEPGVALGGFDDPAPRQELESANFLLVVDAGLGSGADHYHDIVLHSFPSALKARTAFQARAKPVPVPSQRAYKDLVDRRVAAGETPGEAQCGVLEIAGRTVGAAFVGSVAATLVLGEVLRTLARGPRYEVIDLSLKSPQHIDAIENNATGTFTNPGFVQARP